MTAMSAAPRHARTRSLIRKFTVALATFATVFTGVAALGATSASAHSEDSVTICHRTDSGPNPYVQQSHKAKDVWGGHYNVSPDNTVGVYGVDSDWGDIIPEFTYDGHTYGPLNMTTQGLAIYNNDCHIPDVAVTPLQPTSTGGTCETPNMTVTIPTVTGVIYEWHGSLTITPGHHLDVSAKAADGYVLEGYTGPWRFENNYDPNDCIVAVILADPDVTQATCDHSTGEIGGFQITPATTDGIVYSVNGLVVTATVQPGYKFSLPLPAGWTKVSKSVATFTVDRNDPETCLIDATLVAPQVVQSVCTGPGTSSDPSVTPAADSAGISYALALDLSTVTATLNAGYQFALPLPDGWAMSGADAVFATNLVSPGNCLSDVSPVAPEVTQATCNNDTGVISGFAIQPATTAGITYSVEELVVTATADQGYTLGTLPDGWVGVSGTVATFEVTRTDPESCLINATPVAPTVVQAVCTGPGIAGEPTVTPVATTGISYVVSPDFSVTAIADAGYQLVTPLPEGWAPADGDAVFTPTLVSPGDCNSSVLPLVPTAAAATCAAQTMTVTLPTTVGVIYTPSGSLALAPTQSVTITATAAEGYQLVGEVTQWQFTNTLDLTTCGGVGGLVVAEIPQATTPTCQTPDMTVTLPTTTGVIYTASGPLLLAPGESVTITPTADTGFTLDTSAKPTTFTNSFDTASCAGVAGVTTTRPVTQPGLGFTGVAWLRDELVLVFALFLVGTMLTVFARRGRAS